MRPHTTQSPSVKLAQELTSKEMSGKILAVRPLSPLFPTIQRGKEPFSPLWPIETKSRVTVIRSRREIQRVSGNATQSERRLGNITTSL
jgi:hypothetical protein